VEVTCHDIEYGITELLNHGLTTTCVGASFSFPTFSSLKAMILSLP